MRRIRIALFVLVLVGLIVAGVLFAVGYFNPKGAGISIETIPESTVYVNGQQVGRTPYKQTSKPSEITVKLVPDSFEVPLAPYETKTTLVSGIETVIAYQFAETNDGSSGEIVSFDKVGNDETSLAVVSTPDSSQVSIDGQLRGFTPYKTSNITQGEHTLTLSSEGYIEKSINVKTQQGFKLTLIVKLAIDKNSEKPVDEENNINEEDVEGASEEEAVMVEILPTGTGFLRVREEPSTLSDEIARVSPGEKFILLETDEETGWYKIEYLETQANEDDQPSRAGWISNEYAKEVSGTDE